MPPGCAGPPQFTRHNNLLAAVAGTPAGRSGLRRRDTFLRRLMKMDVISGRLYGMSFSPFDGPHQCVAGDHRSGLGVGSGNRSAHLAQVVPQWGCLRGPAVPTEPLVGGSMPLVVDQLEEQPLVARGAGRTFFFDGSL